MSAEEYVYTVSGKAIIPEQLTAEQVNLRDIAYSLSNIYRYNGHSRISVLRHSFALHNLMNDNVDCARYALFHDAAEAYLGDVPVPMKRFITPEWRAAYRHVESVIFNKYEVPTAPDVVARVMAEDKAIVRYEMNGGHIDSIRNIPGRKWSAMEYPIDGSIPALSRPVEEYDKAYEWEYNESDLIDRWAIAVIWIHQPSPLPLATP